MKIKSEIKTYLFLFIFLSFKCFANSSEEFSICDSHSTSGDTCKSNLDSLHPTQMSAGMLEVKKKEEKVKNLLADPSELKKYLIKKAIPAVIGPNGDLYIIDHHHLVLAYLNLGLNSAYCKILDNFSLSSKEEFWKKMSNKNWVYPFDEKGAGPHPFESIPTHARFLKDDVYRSLSAAVRDLDGYSKSEIPYAEFQWANFFRKRITLEKLQESFENAVQQALQMSCSPDARELPGYHCNL